MDTQALARTIAVTTHGRFLVVPPTQPGPAQILIGFHGYGESADIQLPRLHAIPGAAEWTLVSVQGLHRFYDRRNEQVVASWMTRQDREHAIADNLAYVTAVIDEVARGLTNPRIVFTGFSQGVAMTFRAAAGCARPIAGAIAVGGDVPPEIGPDALGRVRAALVCRGARDEWYSTTKHQADVQRLKAASVDVEPLEFDGGHEWGPAVTQAASEFLRRIAGATA